MAVRWRGAETGIGSVSEFQTQTGSGDPGTLPYSMPGE